MREIADIPALLKDFAAYMMLEKGFSANTRVGYADDVAKLVGYLADNRVGLRDVTIDHLQDFMAALHDLGIAPRSQQRINAGVRAFFKYLKLEGYIDENPSLNLENPRMGRHLPEVLSVEEIDAMEAAIDLDAPEGQRNKAIVESSL